MDRGGFNSCMGNSQRACSVLAGEFPRRPTQQLVGPERGERISQLDLIRRRLNVVAAPGQLNRYPASLFENR